MKVTGRIGDIAEHFVHIPRELRRLGFRVVVRRAVNGMTHHIATTRVDWLVLHVAIPAANTGGVAWAVLYERGPRVSIRSHLSTLHATELIDGINRALGQLEFETS